MFDEGLSQSYSDVQIKLLAYLEQVDREKYNVYVSTSRVCQSMQKTCKFLMLCQQEVSGTATTISIMSFLLLKNVC